MQTETQSQPSHIIQSDQMNQSQISEARKSRVSNISLALVLGVRSERTRPRICGLLREMSPKYSMLTKHSTPLALAGMLYPLWPTAAVRTNKGASLNHYTYFLLTRM